MCPFNVGPFHSSEKWCNGGSGRSLSLSLSLSDNPLSFSPISLFLLSTLAHLTDLLASLCYIILCGCIPSSSYCLPTHCLRKFRSSVASLSRFIRVPTRWNLWKPCEYKTHRHFRFSINDFWKVASGCSCSSNRRDLFKLIMQNSSADDVSIPVIFKYFKNSSIVYPVHLLQFPLLR